MLTTITSQAKVLKMPFQGEEGSESSGTNSGLGSLENREDGGGTGKSNHQVIFDNDDYDDDYDDYHDDDRDDFGDDGNGYDNFPSSDSSSTHNH